ncbi:MAG: response regulator [Desulfobacteraceae bacterium]|nr:response regulator [Desulfobacteraceae bacterium]
MEVNPSDILDIQKVQMLTDAFYKATRIPSSIISTDAQVLTESGWQDICHNFHRKHPQAEKDCIRSNINLCQKLLSGKKHVLYHCPHGLIDAVAPVVIGGEHIANFFTGRFLFEKPDADAIEQFKEQAARYEFDQKDYLAGFHKIPVIPKKRVEAILDCLTMFAELIAEMGLTQRKQYISKKEAKETYRRYQLLFNSLNDAVFVHKIKKDGSPGRFIEVNEEACRRLGYTRDEFLKFSPKILNKDKDSQMPEKLGKELIKKGHVRFEAVHVTRDERLIPVESNVKVFEYHNKMYVLSIARDITDQKAAEKAQKRELELNKAVADISKELLSKAYDLKRVSIITLQYAKKLTKSAHGHVSSSDENIRKHVGDILGLNKQSINTEDPFFSNSPQIQSKSEDLPEGHIPVEKFLSVPIKIGDVFIGRIALANPRTKYFQTDLDAVERLAEIYTLALHRQKFEKEKMSLEGQLVQLQKMEALGALASGIAHDFNNLLFPIIGFAEMLEMDIGEENPSVKLVKEVLIGANRAKELVQQILLFSRQTEHQNKPLKPHLVVREAIKLIRHSLPSTIAVKQDIRKDCYPIMGDPTQVHQVVMNLSTNAFHAMQDTGGKLTVSLKNVFLQGDEISDVNIQSGPYVELCISDTGMGMDEIKIGKMFEPYYTTKPMGKGTGLGLSVVHGIIKSHGGHIDVKSKPAEGTVFHVYFPGILAECTPEKMGKKSFLADGKEKIMLVDDEESVLKIEMHILERLGYQVSAYTSSKEAYEAFKSRPNEFDIVITDVTMPNMTGDILIEKINKIRLDIPCIICTGFSNKISTERARELGLNELLLKPIASRQFAEKVRKALDTRHENQ